jgi:hypothetical protein
MSEFSLGFKSRSAGALTLDRDAGSDYDGAIQIAPWSIRPDPMIGLIPGTADEIGAHAARAISMGDRYGRVSLPAGCTGTGLVGYWNPTKIQTERVGTLLAI